MITCRKCKQTNPSEAQVCQNCGKDLLPGASFQDRIFEVIFGIVGSAISIGILYFLTKNPALTETSQCCLITNPAIWYLGIFFFPISGIIGAIRKTPLYKRYENRAILHLDIDPEQALADLSEAISLAPEKQKAPLLKRRAELLSKLGREEASLEDRLDYMESDGAYEGQANLAQLFKADSDAMVSSARASERKQLLVDGKIKAVGFCPKCLHAVALNENSRCEVHPKSKPIGVKYVLPKNLESTLSAVEEEGAKQYKKIKRTRMVIMIIVVAVIVLCIVIPLITGLIGKLAGG